MSNHRQDRLNTAVCAELAAIMRDVKDPRVSGAFISIAGANVAPDLSEAKIYYSVLGDDTDVDKAAGDVCKSVRLRSTLYVVKLDAENAFKLTEEECVGTSSWHTGIDLSRICLCIFNEFCECVEWSIDRASEN